MLATTKQVRKFARSIYGRRFGYAGTYTDKAQNGMRRVVFRLYDKADADKLATGLQEALFVAGFENYEVKRTSSMGGDMRRTWGGEYVRVKALLG